MLGGHVGVEQAGVAEVSVPHLVNGVTDELGGCTFGCFLRCKVTKQDSIFSFMLCAVHGGGIVSNGRVGWRVDGDGECCPPRGSVRSRGFDEAAEVVGASLLVRDVKEQGVEGLAEGGEVIIGWLVCDVREGGCGSGKKGGNFFR